MRNKFHVLRGNDKLNMGNLNMIFFDTETNTHKKDETTVELKLKLGTGIYWIRDLDYTEKFDFYDISGFWDKVESFDAKHLYLIAHNMDFDFKVLRGYNELFVKRGWEATKFYVQGNIFIITCKKEDKKLTIISSTNFFPCKLEKLGESVGYPKLKIDFDTCSDKQLLTYCRRDTEILFKVFVRLLETLEDNDLSKFKTTSSSLAFNTFRHRFYDTKKNPVMIHTWKTALELERNAYKGGITDCFKVGEFNEKLFKLDVNSMYPSIMKKERVPTKLRSCETYYHKSHKKLKENLESYLKNNILTIAHVEIELPEKYAYILVKGIVDKKEKSLFASGTFEICLASPELNFVKKYGKIKKVFRIATYEGCVLFKEYIEHFYNERGKAKKNEDGILDQFNKLMMNSLYGKFGQRKIVFEKVGESEKNAVVKKTWITNDETDNENLFVQEGFQFGKDIFEIKKTKELSFDSFLPIPVFITSYARMKLVDYVLKAERENCYYADTDCVIVNKKGYNKLGKELDDKKLGYLKLEETSDHSMFIRPKWYHFNENKKCKGIKKNAKVVSESDNEITFEQEQFLKSKTAIRKGLANLQTVSKVKKTLDKTYDKGVVEKGIVFPYLACGSG